MIGARYERRYTLRAIIDAEALRAIRKDAASACLRR